MKHFASLVILAGLCLAYPAHGQTVCFNSSSDYTFTYNSNLRSVDKGDLNGDGHLDLVAGIGIGTNIYVVLGNGSGGFGAVTSYPIGGSAPLGVKLYDFNGDTKLDVVTANRLGNNISVCFGNGTGGFGAATNYSTGASTSPNGVDVGDFNADGVMDIIVSHQTGTSGFVYFQGVAGGTFTFVSDNAMGTSSKGVAIADYNEDGKLDVAVANQGGSSVSVSLGTGTGTFGAATNFTVGNTPYMVRQTDINGDGHKDLVVPNSVGASMSVLIGTGTGSFAAADTYTAGATPYCVVAQDFNEDTKMDVVVLNDAENTISVYLGTGINVAGSRFSAQVKYSIVGVPFEMVAGDFKEDTHLDIAIPPGSGTSGILARGVGDGTFLLEINPATGAGPNGVAQGDFNGDGFKDLVVANKTAGNFSYLAGNNDGTYDPAVNFTTGTSPAAIYAADLNGDSKLDVVTANSGSSNVSVFIGTGTGSFGAATNFTTAALPVSVICKDFNNDSKPDIATANSTTNNVSVLIGTGTGSFGAATNFTVATNASDIVAGLFNGDSNLDLAVSNQGSNNVSVLLGTGTGSFGAATNFTVATAPMSIDAADLNSDGNIDLATANNTTNNVSVIMGTGTGSFGAATNYAVNTAPQAIVIADFNNDSKPDIATANKIAASSTSTVSVLVNSGTGTFGTASNFSTGINSIALVATLSNNDPLLDLAVANFDVNNMSILLNGTAVITPSGSTTFCAGASVDLVSTPANNYSWSNGATTQSITVSASGTFTVTNSNLSGTCTSTSAAVTVTVSGSGPTPPTLSGTTVLCVPGSTTLTETPSAPSVDIEWWTAPTGGTKLSDNNTYTTPVLSTTTTYYVNVQDTVNGCSLTSRIPVTVNVGDAINPVITGMPANITQNVAAGSCSKTVSWTAPTATDNCAMGTLTTDHAIGSSFPVGVTIVTYTATDVAGNTTTASFTVTIVDNINPTLSGMPSNITQSVTSGCTKTVSWTAPTAGDNCSATLSVDHAIGSSFPVGTTTVTYTATDPSGNTTTSSFTVTITDGILPTISGMPANITQNVTAGTCGKVVTWTAPTASDNCTLASFTSSSTSGSTFPVGVTTVTYTATDAAGNVKTASFTITIVDNINPTISGMPSNITQNASAGTCGKVVTWTAPTAADNCSVSSFTSTSTSGSTFPVGVTTVTYTATDASGNIATASFTITIVDNVLPTISGMPANITQNVTAGSCSKVVTWTAPTASDNCSVSSFTSTSTSGSTFPVGTTTVTYTATDASGNVTTASFTITIVDNIFPTISGMPANITQNAAAGSCSKTVSWTAPTAADNCTVSSFVTDHASGSSFPVGVTTVTYTATDASGNITTASFTVTIVDNINPTLSGVPSNITQNVTAGTCGKVVTWTSPTASDNCTFTMTSTHSSGETFPVGTTTVLYTVTDASGNTATGSFTITIIDNINPTISGMPSNITQSVASGCSKTVSWTAPTASDNCTVTLTTDHAIGSSFPVGTTTVTYTATDASGNVTTASFTVTITDGILPTISGMPSNITTNVTAGTCSATVTWTAPTAADNCSLASFTSTSTSGSTFPVGVTTVTYTATDASGNVKTASFTITVVDNIFPTISGMPANITQNVTAGSCSKTVSWTAPTASDNCSVTSFSGDHTSGSSFPVGVTTVTYTAIDPSGNTTTASFTVTIVDNINPTLSGVPSNITQNTTVGMCGANVSWTSPTAGDNCTFTLTTTNAPGSFFPVGTTTVTYTVTDASGNTASGSFTVTIIDNIFPTITGMPANITQSVTSGCTKNVSWTAPTGSDNCAFTLVTDHASGSSFPVGTTTVTYTATDASGNVTTASFTVTITDGILPTISGMPSNITTNVAAGTCGAVVSWTSPTASDNCTLASFTSTSTSGSTFPVGVTTVTYTATDAAGNVKTASFTITVVDNIFPVISGMPSNITMTIAPGTCSNVATWTAPTASDNCSVSSFTSTSTSGSTFPAGTTTVTYTAIDPSGNTTTASFTVTIVDNISPTISGVPSNITQNVTVGMCGANVTWTAPTGNDNCTFTMTTTNAPGTFFPVGTTTVTYTVTDASSNTATGSFTVTIIDNINPTISGVPANITQNTTTLCGKNVSWTAPTKSDNCSATLTTDHAIGSFFPVGTTTVTYTATDPSGNTTTATFTVTINDVTLPTITGLSNKTVNVAPGTCSAVVTWTAPTITDNCAVASSSSTFASGSTFPVGVTTVTYTATDIHGNVRNTSFTVTVVDNIFPTISGMPANITQNLTSGCSKNISWTAPTASDNCSATLTVDHAIGSSFPVGTTTVTYTATDPAGHVTTASFTVTIVDAITPTISGMPANITVNADPGVCGANVSWTAPTASDNCSVTLTGDHTSGSAFPVGVTTVTYTATDPSGNTATGSFTITVIDNVNPVVSAMADVIVDNDPGLCGATVSWTTPGSSDVCGISTLTSSIASGTFFNTGSTPVTYTATDVNGNIGTMTFNVIVIDTQAPMMTGTPLDITVSNDSSICGAVVTWTDPTGSDNCSVASITSTDSSGTTFPVGTTTVTFTATDASGNTTTTSFNITVNDTENPGFSSFPADISIPAAAGMCSNAATWTLPVGYDNCSVASITSTDSSGTTFPVGTTTVTYTITDVSGNSIDSSFTVTIVDSEAPIVSACPSDIVQCEGSVVNFSAPTGTDNCGGTVTVTQISGLTSGSVFPVGTTMVTYQVADSVGNASTCSFNVTINANPAVVYATQPDTTCPTYPAITLSGGSPAGGTYSGTGVSGGMFNPSVAGMGTHDVIYTFTDVNGCTASDTAQIVVDDCSGISNHVAIQYNFSVYPNPSKGMFVLQLSNLPTGETARIAVYNNLGEAVYTIQTTSDRVDLDLQDKANGIYIVKINVANYAGSKQIIVQR